MLLLTKRTESNPKGFIEDSELLSSVNSSIVSFKETSEKTVNIILKDLKNLSTLIEKQNKENTIKIEELNSNIENKLLNVDKKIKSIDLSPYLTKEHISEYIKEEKILSLIQKINNSTRSSFEDNIKNFNIQLNDFSERFDIENKNIHNNLNQLNKDLKSIDLSPYLVKEDIINFIEKKELSKHINNFNNSINTLQESQNLVKSEINSNFVKIEDYKEGITKLQKENNNLKKQNTELENKIKDLYLEINKFTNLDHKVNNLTKLLTKTKSNKIEKLYNIEYPETIEANLVPGTIRYDKEKDKIRVCKQKEWVDLL